MSLVGELQQGSGRGGLGGRQHLIALRLWKEASDARQPWLGSKPWLTVHRMSDLV